MTEDTCVNVPQWISLVETFARQVSPDVTVTGPSEKREMLALNVKFTGSNHAQDAHTFAGKISTVFGENAGVNTCYQPSDTDSIVTLHITTLANPAVLETAIKAPAAAAA